MPRSAVQRARGTTAQHLTFTGLPGEVTVDTDRNTLVVHDGVTPGGFPLARPAVFSVSDYGAKGDASTDDTSAINTTITAAQLKVTGACRPVLHFPFSLGYRAVSSIVVPAGIDVQMDAPLLYAGTGTALTIGAAGNLNLNARLTLNVTRSTQSAWADSSVGVKLYNCYTSRIDIVEVAGFQDGIQCIGDGYGFVHNETTLRSLRNNKVGLKLTTGAGVGWCNENNFYGGRFDCSSGVNTSVSRNGVVVTSGNGGYNNNNVFHKPSFELSADTLTGGAIAVAILMEYGQLNAFHDLRWENSGTTLAVVSNSSYRNEFMAGYGFVLSTSITHSGVYKDSVAWSRNNRIPKSPVTTTVFHSGPLAKLANPYGATDVFISGLHAATTGSSDARPNHSLMRLTARYVDVSATRLVGVFVSTTVQKRFVIRRDFESTGNPGRVVIRAYDVNGAVLGTGHIFGADGYNWSYDAGYSGGSYYSAPSTADIYFAASDTVDKVAVLVGGPDSGYTPLRSFSIDSIDGGSPAAWAGVNTGLDAEPGPSLATQSPVIWANAVARHLWHAEPASGGPAGWSRVFRTATSVSGTEAGGQTVITVASAAGIASGDIVTVQLDNGDYHHTTVNGAPAGNDVTLTVALPSQASNGKGFWAARWKAMANLA